MGQTKAPTMARFKIDGEIYEMEEGSLTLAEGSEIEAYFDRDFEALSGTQSILAMVYVAMKRKDPTVTFDSVGTLKVNSISEAKADRPTPAPRASGGKRST